jgi:6-phosphofructokinase 2
VKSIITLTINPTVDTASGVGHVIADRKLRCVEPTHQPGGGGINVTRVIKRLGGESVPIYPAGGFSGRMLQHLLSLEGIDPRPVRIRGPTRQDFTITEEASGRQYRFGMPGPALTGGELKRTLDALRRVDPSPELIVASGSLPPEVPGDTYAMVAGIAVDLGARLVVDASGEALRQAVLAGVFMIKPNIRELCELSGTSMKDQWQVKEAAEDIVRSGKVEIVVVSMGSAGALAVTKKSHVHVRAPVVPVGSRVGAGDSLVGAMVLAIARGEGIRDALYRGVAASSAAVMTPGTGLCMREDAERLHKMMVNRAEGGWNDDAGSLSSEGGCLDADQ